MIDTRRRARQLQAEVNKHKAALTALHILMGVRPDDQALINMKLETELIISSLENQINKISQNRFSIIKGSDYYALS